MSGALEKGSVNSSAVTENHNSSQFRQLSPKQLKAIEMIQEMAASLKGQSVN